MEEPPSKVSKFDMSAEYLDESFEDDEQEYEQEDGQEEWLSEEILTDDDYSSVDKKVLSNNESDYENASSHNGNNTQPNSTKQESKLKKEEITDDLDEILLTKTPVRINKDKINGETKVVVKEKKMVKKKVLNDYDATDAETSDSGNDTDDLLRMLGDDVKKKIQRKEGNRNKETAKKPTMARGESSDEDTNSTQSIASRLKTVTKNVKKATIAEPEESDSDTEMSSAGRDVEDLKNMFASNKSTAKPAPKSKKTPLKTNLSSKKKETVATKGYQLQLRSRKSTNSDLQRRPSPVSKPSSVRKPSPVSKLSQVRKPSPVSKRSPVRKPSPARKPSPLSKRNSVRKSSPVSLSKPTRFSNSKTYSKSSPVAKAIPVVVSKPSPKSTPIPKESPVSKVVLKKSPVLQAGAILKLRQVAKPPLNVQSPELKASPKSHTSSPKLKPSSDSKLQPSSDSKLQPSSDSKLQPSSDSKPQRSLDSKPKPGIYAQKVRVVANTIKKPNPKVYAPKPKIEKKISFDEIIDEDDFNESSDGFDLDDDLGMNSDEEESKGRLRLMEPERMDEEMPSDFDTSEEDSYSEIASSDSDDDWFTIDVRSEKAAEYLPLLGSKAYEVLSQEKERVGIRLRELKRSVRALTDSSKTQSEQVKEATAALGEIEALIKAT